TLSALFCDHHRRPPTLHSFPTRRSSDLPVGDADETHFGDLIEDKAAENPSEVTSFNLLRGRLSEVLHGLAERERRILELRYGLRSEEHTSELQSPDHLVCRLLLEKKKKH